MILIIDFGSQYNQLIARRVREWKIFCQIEPPTISTNAIRALNPDGIILSGGPASIYEKNSPKIDKGIFDLNIPVLGICYGMHYMVDALGGKVKKAKKREYGFAELHIRKQSVLFAHIDSATTCWMSHGDSIEILPQGFEIAASTDNTEAAAAQHINKRFFALQFHPEVQHTEKGAQMLKNFLFEVCGCRPTWTMKSFADNAVEEICETTRDKNVILGLSGGVDSSVAAVLIHRAIGPRLTCIFIDNGLLRKNEGEKLKSTLKERLNVNIRFVQAKKNFWNPCLK